MAVRRCPIPVQHRPGGQRPGALLPRRPFFQRLYGDGTVFAFWRERPRLARSFVVLGILLGLAMGFGQVMRGAHFSLTTCGPGGGSGFPVAVYGLVSTRFAKE